MDARPRRRRPRTAEEAAATLRKAWCRLRPSARDPARVPPWDAVVLTAASPQQGALYNRQLECARALGRFSASTAAIAVPDPDGARIGSGAATLHVVARHLAAQFTTHLPSALPTIATLLYSTRPVVLMAYWDVGIFFAGFQGRDRRIPSRSSKWWFGG